MLVPSRKKIIFFLLFFNILSTLYTHGNLITPFLTDFKKKEVLFYVRLYVFFQIIISNFFCFSTWIILTYNSLNQSTKLILIIKRRRNNFMLVMLIQNTKHPTVRWHWIWKKRNICIGAFHKIRHRKLYFFKSPPSPSSRHVTFFATPLINIMSQMIESP